LFYVGFIDVLAPFVILLVILSVTIVVVIYVKCRVDRRAQNWVHQAEMCPVRPFDVEVVQRQTYALRPRIILDASGPQGIAYHQLATLLPGVAGPNDIHSHV